MAPPAIFAGATGAGKVVVVAMNPREPVVKDRQPFRTTGVTRLFFAVFWLIFSGIMAVEFAQTGSVLFLFWAIVAGLAAVVTGLVYFGTRSIEQENKDNHDGPAKQ